MKTLPRLALAATAFALAPAYAADDFPVKPVQIVVPFAPGGGSDTLARLIAQKLNERWKQPVVVVNKAGADGNIGAQFVAAAPKDGYTLMVLDVGTLTIGPAFYKNLPFNPATAFAAVTALTFSPHVLVVNPSLPTKNFAELRELARNQPDKLNFASHNNSAALAGYKLSAETGLKLTQVPYKGAGAAMTALIGGEVNVTLVSLLLASQQIAAGQLQPIAIASRTRNAAVPQVPTLIEAGVPNYVMGSWQGVVAPAGTPAGVVRTINVAIADVLKDPAVRQRLEAQGAEVIANSPQEFAEMLADQARTFQAVARQAQIQPQ